ncbi:MAG: UDP-N-acetylmuramate dehydrogenase [Peptostreptococcaceae bacterium]|nr:UDP-N-acetylmuramate dehydrogenase [Peptostreptococcaceae bacterium]
MKEYTSFKAGGRASMLVLPKNTEELKRVLKIVAISKKEFLVMGNGSNILVRDGGFDGIIIKLGEGFNQITVNKEDQTLMVGASALLSRVARETVEAELTGFEFASGIPGSMGGALFMNAGAYGWEMSQIVREARVISRDGSREYTLLNDKMELGYRSSIFEKTGDIIISVKLKLDTGEKEKISETMKNLTARRNEKQPMNFPSAGSFFKRPEGNYAGKLIEEAGLKGLMVGDARVSPLHAGFIINTGNAKAKDIISLMKLVQSTVYDKTGIKLEPEVRIIGED